MSEYLQNKFIQAQNNPSTIKIFLILVLALVIYLSVLVYGYDFLNIYPTIGGGLIIFTCLLVIVLVFQISYMHIFYKDTKAFTVYRFSNDTIKTFLKFGKYIGISLLIFFAFYITFNKLVTSGSTENIVKFFYVLIALFLIYIVLKLIIRFRPKLFDFDLSIFANHLLKFLYQLMLFLPYALGELGKYIKSEWVKTNKTELLILLLIIVSTTLYFTAVPILKSLLYRSSVNLLEETKYLNRKSFLGNISKIQNELYEKSTINYVNNEIYSTFYDDDDKNSSQETFINLNNPNNSYQLNKMSKDNPDINQEMVKDITKKYPDLATSLNTMMDSKDNDGVLHMLKQLSKPDNTFLDNLAKNSPVSISTSTTISDAAKPSLKYYLRKPSHDYSFSISLWVFLENDGTLRNSYNSIFNYGDVIEILYNPYTKDSLFKSTSCREYVDTDSENDDRCQSRNLFKTKKIVFQRWNNVVVNCDDNILDIYVNGELVYTEKSFAVSYSSDLIYCGSNSDLQGAICNINYFDYPLTKRYIGLLYSIYKNKSVPKY